HRRGALRRRHDRAVRVVVPGSAARPDDHRWPAETDPAPRRMSDGTGFLRELLVATAAGSVSAIGTDPAVLGIGTDPAVLGIGTDPAVRRAADLLPGRVKVAESPARARARFGGREAFGCIYTVAVPEFHTDPGEVAALVPLLAPDA